MRLSDRVMNLAQSSTLAVMARAKEMRREGIDVLSFAAGEPDFDTPDVIKQAAMRGITDGLTKYMPSQGDPDARAAIARKLREENGIADVGPEHVVIGVGGKHCLYLAYQSLVDYGRNDQAVVLTPGWVSYRPQLELAGAEVVEVDSSVDNDFKVKPEDLASALTSRTRVVTINNPSNPCGTTYTKDELAALAEVIVRHNRDVGELHVVSDEIYEYLVYGGAEFTAFATCHPDVAPYTITVNGLSKAYAMTGWRVGYAAAPVHDGGVGLIKAMSKLQAQMTTCIPAFVYPAIEIAMTQAGDDVKRMQAAFAERAALIHRLIAEIPGFKCPRPTGAFYVFPDITAHFGRTSGGGRPINSALDFAEALLLEKQMAVVPGDDFGGCGPNHIRLSFACGPEQIEAGMERLSAFVDELG